MRNVTNRHAMQVGFVLTYFGLLWLLTDNLAMTILLYGLTCLALGVLGWVVGKLDKIS